MEIGQGPNWGFSAEEKKITSLTDRRIEVYRILLLHYENV
jgi:hypothetical protein